MQQTDFLKLSLTGEEDYESNFEDWQAALNGVENSNAKIIDQFAAHVYGRSGILTLTAGGWSAVKAQTVAVEELGEDDAILISPVSREDQDNMSVAGLFATARKGEATFSANITPSNDIKLNFFIVRGRK